MAGLVTDYMESYGTRFVWRAVPKRVDKLSSGTLQVTWRDTETGAEHEDTYNSVLWAVGEFLWKRLLLKSFIYLFTIDDLLQWETLHLKMA